MEYRCPKCDSLIYSRKHKLCGKCGSVLPPELLFSEDHIKKLNQQMTDERKRAREFNLPDSSGGVGFGMSGDVL